jgi:tripartite-type tricarboxylate transporter receptor subunit TctC
LDVVAKAPPDGYTVALIAAGNLVINPFIYKTMPFNAFEDLVAVAPVADAPQILVVRSSLPVKDLREFIALTKSKPGEFHYGSGGVGTTNHLAGDLFCRIAGVEMVHVPYRGVAPVVTDLVAGRIEMLSVGPAPVMEHVKAGTIRALAAASKERAPGLPELPTSAEAGLPNFEMNTWFGVVAPAKTPPEIVIKLNQLVSNMSSDPSARKLLRDAYLRPMHLSPAQFKELVTQDAKQWSIVVKNAGIVVE